MLPAMEIPSYVAITSYACLFIALAFVFFASRKSQQGLLLWVGLLVVLLAIGLLVPSHLSATYTWLLSFVPSILVIGLVASQKWPAFTQEMGDEYLHYFHLWRLPAAFIPLWLYQSGLAPLQITFEGLNFDIIAGLTAPVLSSLAFSQQMLNRTVVLVWNVIAALLLISSNWLLIAEMGRNSGLAELMISMPYAALLFSLSSMSLAFHILAVVRISQGKMQLAE
ncbi:MAG: hypothetical protein C0424_06935 [Sphingobacteriaceae bacterium]|nr:hypothetical protein [Sphingobacteriaceae bacterium]